MLNSLVYDYAKHMADLCPLDENGVFAHKEFFPNIFERFWIKFPNLELAHEESLKRNVTDADRLSSTAMRPVKQRTRCTMSTVFVRCIRKAQGVKFPH